MYKPVFIIVSKILGGKKGWTSCIDIYTAGLALKENNKSSIVWWLTPVILSETQILGIF